MELTLYELEHRTLAYQWSHTPVAQPLIVIHGLGDSAIHTYAPRFASTALHRTPALFIDFPGFGLGSASAPYSGTIEAMTDDIASLLAHLGVGNAPIFAHSMGASIAMVLGAKHLGLSSVLILAEPFVDPANSVLAARTARYSEPTFIDRGYGMLVRATALQARRGDAAAIAFLPTLKQANPMALHRAAVSLLQNRKPSFFELLERLPHPTNVLLGQDTRISLPPLQREGIQVKRVKSAGHHLIVEAAEPTACVILESINRGA